MDILERLAPYYAEDIDGPYHLLFSEDLERLKEMDQEELRELLEHAIRPTFLQPGTLGAYLFGPLQGYYGAVHRDCSIFCVSTLLNKKDRDCSSSIWTLGEKGLICLHQGTSGHAYVYSERPLTDQETLFLSKQHHYAAERVTLYHGIHYVHPIHLPLLY